ncbi:hypothetical protein DFH27DRAFT_181204 [Peziza echinospora]|nr:hypothetical protein DFH27DRAFT_181204 [Peziza echinospora]
MRRVWLIVAHRPASSAGLGSSGPVWPARPCPPAGASHHSAGPYSDRAALRAAAGASATHGPPPFWHEDEFPRRRLYLSTGRGRKHHHLHPHFARSRAFSLINT